MVEHSPRQPPAVFLMGPTASGKTELAVRLADRLSLDIISVDSAMVYRGLDIGTAKPGREVLARAPHRLIDIVELPDAYSAARFREDALREMAASTAAGRVPLLVGGTMLYFRVLERGLARLPSADPDLRARLAARARREGWPALHAELARVDPETAARLQPGDSQRIQRALEVWELTGRPLAAWHRDPSRSLPYRPVRLALLPAERRWLHARIAARLERMLEAGFLEEVRGLHARGDLSEVHPAVRAVGYRQLWGHLEGRYGREEAVARAAAATRQFAKRQITWLRGWAGLRVFDPLDPELVDKVTEHLRRELSN